MTVGFMCRKRRRRCRCRCRCRRRRRRRRRCQLGFRGFGAETKLMDPVKYSEFFDGFASIR